jgi:soluble lytic murein transglycosylase-like protein
MSIKRIAVAILAAGYFLLLPIPGQAQLASYIDAHGNRIYINGDSPKRQSRSTIKTPAPRAAASQPLTAPSYPSARIERIVDDAAARHQVDPALVKAVINTESGWNPTAISRKGAMGLMQLIPGTAERFGVGNPFDPAQNIEAGTSYLKSLLERYNGDLSKSLAAYNAGEGAVDRSGGVPWFPETRQYVRKVTDAYFRPDSGRNPTLWSPPSTPVRKEVEPDGRVVFTNE